MSEAAFVQAVTTLLVAVNESFDKPAKLPAFILFYSTIDIMASLTRPVGNADTDGGIYKQWVNDYLLPNSNLPCNAEDLWAARCGLLHTFTIESRNSRRSIARRLHYIGDRGLAQFSQQQIDPNAVNDVFVCLQDLLNAFRTAMHRFTQNIINDDQLRATVYAHSAKLVIHERAPVPPRQ